MQEREVVVDDTVEPQIDQQSVALRNAVERAERAEAELAKVREADHSATAPDAKPTDEPHVAGQPQMQGPEALRADEMMAHLLDALERGEDIGHYGRLVFTMVARHFLSGDELIAELTRDRDFSEEQARAMVQQVEERGYNPPRRERIIQWQSEQRFPIIPRKDDPDCGNVYKTLRFERATYDHIEEYREEKAEAA